MTLTYRAIVVSGLLVAALVPGAAATELSTDDIIRAHRAGVRAETMLQLIETADTVPQLSEQVEAELTAAGVPPAVIEALRQRLARPEAAGSTAVEPDDPRLVDIVRLVDAGLADSLIIEHISQSPQPYRPSVDDLIFLEKHQVPETVIAALLARPTPEPPRSVPPPPHPTPVPSRRQDGHQAAFGTAEVWFGPVLRFTRSAGMITRKTRGRIGLVEDRIEYHDDKKGERSISFFDSVLKKVWLECEPNADEPLCFEIAIKTAHGDTFHFRDVDWKSGGNRQIMALWDTLKQRYPNAKFKMKD